MKIRSVQSAFAEIKAEDPATAITEYMIRKIVYGGEIPVIQRGNKKLFDMEVLLHYLEGGRS